MGCAPLLVLAVAACDLYVDSPAGEDDCWDSPYGSVELRDPATGACVLFSPEPCGTGEVPDWGLCDSACEAITSEAACRAATGCRAVYVLDGETLRFDACWATGVPTAGGTLGDCVGLEADACSRREDCSAVHAGDRFASCSDEAAACAAPPALRNPESGACEPTGACEAGLTDGPAGPDWAACGDACEAHDEATCLAAPGCRVIHANICPPLTSCYAERFAACWPVAPSGPVTAGACAGLDAHECSRRDACLAVHDRDWTAWDAAAEPSAAPLTWFLDCRDEPLAPPVVEVTCGEILAEAACVEAGCEPVLIGSGCTEDGVGGYDCETWTFAACRDPA